VGADPVNRRKCGRNAAAEEKPHERAGAQACHAGALGVRGAEGLQERGRRGFGRVPPVRDDDQIRGPDGVQVIGHRAGQAAAGQRGVILAGHDPDIDVGQHAVVRGHVEHAERERHDAERNPVEHHHHVPPRRRLRHYRRVMRAL
jgi:hypothetical protein